jgi:ATP-dependent Clp protease protease subunit
MPKAVPAPAAPPVEKAKKPAYSPMLARYLKRARAVMVYGEIDSKLTREVVTQLLVLDQASREKPIRVFVNSPGGLADDGFGIYDMLRFVRAPVYTICAGIAASAATLILLGAEKGRRLILPHARVMLHQPSSGIRGTASDIAVSAKELIRLRKKSIDLYARETGRPPDQLERDLARDYWMTAEEAIAYGICDRVVTKADEVGRK